jgi:acyl-CoA:acyl-CoA alkyltransferase
MKFQHVGLASIGYTLPPEVIRSDEIERRLQPLYERLRLPEGRLAMMSGIEERRLWSVGTRLSDMSAKSCQRALQAAAIDPSKVGALIHGSVCREFLEPATACRVHHLCGLPNRCWTYDISNACLGILNGAVQIASLIESGQISAGLVVGTEDSRGLLEATLQSLLADQTMTRQTIKPAFASLTIGSASCAWLLVDRRQFPQSAPVLNAVARSDTHHHALCQSHQDQAGQNMQPTMDTDSEQLLLAGLETGAATFEDLLKDSGWERTTIEQTTLHQVGSAHRKLMLERLQLSSDQDFAVFSHLGNTGSVALPTALGIGIQRGFLKPGKRTALLGIGSGINSIMLTTILDGIQVAGDPLEGLPCPQRDPI